ncbi:ubiquinol-cytochrome-c reductase complex assembly factor 3 [Scyliorhinus canicula]|uniref:ubiquinol-cytochrome-c reductase complex assembly factor 3 n=1 Tax=Scyliorhinus canicula TaxID=7830 RepID=UPI0018F4D557|nr:ubiquinol-cytochrome-c reductase complex assembly factor 3 [Scyliorhinus canicula]
MRSRGLASGIWTLLVAAAAGVCWAAAGPTEQRRRQIVRHLPESNKAHLEASRKRNTLVMQIIEESAHTEKNVAQKRDWNKFSRSDS